MKRALRPLYRRITIPIHSVLNAILSQRILEDIHAVQLFGNGGDALTKVYAPHTSSLQIWEIDPAYERSLRDTFPNATVKIVDSFEEVKRTNDKFNLIVIDNPLSTYGSYCEHFELFTAIYRIMCEKAILILNVIPKVNRWYRAKQQHVFTVEHLRRRAEFYHTDRPEVISLRRMIDTYREISEANGYAVRWHYVKRKGFTFLYFLALYVECASSSNWQESSYRHASPN
jgi:hypothetical protein